MISNRARKRGGRRGARSRYLFSAAAFRDLAKLAKKLRDGRDVISMHLRMHLTENTQKLLDEHDDTKSLTTQLQEALIAELNRLLKGPNLFNNQHFAHVQLRDSTRNLLTQNPQNGALIRLNRFLLEDVYPESINRIHFGTSKSPKKETPKRGAERDSRFSRSQATAERPEPETAERSEPENTLRHQRRETSIELIIRNFNSWLRKKVPLEKNKEQLLSKVINEFLRKPECNRLQWNSLKVCGGAFGLAHHSSKHFILLQTDNPIFENQEDVIKGIKIPYLPEVNERYQELVDYLFLGKRRLQPLSSELKHEFAPEFYWYFAQNYNSATSYSDSDYWHPYKLVKKTELDIYLSRKMRVPYLYCPAGEVSFFLYAWRLMFRLFQKSAPDDPVELRLDMQEHFPCRDIWHMPYWEHLTQNDADDQLSFPEADWLRSLQEPLNRDFRDAVEAQWSFWRLKTDVENYPGLTPWLSDWVRLCLLEFDEDWNSRPTEILLSLVLYAFNIEPRSHVRGSLKHVADIINQAVSGRRRLGQEEITDIDRLLQDVVKYLLTKHNCEIESLPTMLSLVHKLARFPILPLFYWTVASGIPKEHFVFPVWESWQFPIKLKVPLLSPEEKKKHPKDRKNFSEVTLPFVGISLLELAPKKTLDAPYQEKVLGSILTPDEDLRREAGFSDREAERFKIYSRLANIARFYRRIARPFIDNAFYGILVKDSSEREATLSVRTDLAATFSHAYQKRATMFVNSFTQFLERTLAVDLWTDLTTGETNSPVANEFYQKGRLDNDTEYYGEIYNPKVFIKRSDLAFAFDHREALEWYKEDIDIFYRISRFDKTFQLDKFQKPGDDEKTYLYHLVLAKLVESILVLRYQGGGAQAVGTIYHNLFKNYRPSKEWAYLLFHTAREIAQEEKSGSGYSQGMDGVAQEERSGTRYLEEVEAMIFSSDFPINFQVEGITVRKAKYFLNRFVSSVDKEAINREQKLLVDILGKIYGEIFLNSLKSSAGAESPHFELTFTTDPGDPAYFYFDITSNCKAGSFQEFGEDFQPPPQPDYQKGWGRYGNSLIMRDYLNGEYLERRTRDNMVTTRIKFPSQIIGADLDE
jgi:hypothetical protein